MTKDEKLTAAAFARTHARWVAQSRRKFDEADIRRAREVIEHICGKRDVKSFLEFLEASGLGSHPELLRFVLRVDDAMRLTG